MNKSTEIVIYCDGAWRHQSWSRDNNMTDVRKTIYDFKVEKIKTINETSERDELDKSI